MKHPDKTRFWVLALAFTLFAVAGASGQTANRVDLKLSGVPKSVTAGEKFDARLVAKIEDGWHVYSLTKIASGPIPTQITLAVGQPFALGGEILSPLPTVDRDSAFGVDVEFYEGETEFTLPIKVDSKARPGARQLSVDIRFQVCSGSICLRPQTINLTAPVTIAKAGSRSRPSRISAKP